MSRPSATTDTSSGPDALVRSKYDQREDDTGRPLTTLALGVVFANAFMMLKDMLYGRQLNVFGTAAAASGGAPSDGDVLSSPAVRSGTAAPPGSGSKRADARQQGPSEDVEGANLVKFQLRGKPVVVFESGDTLVTSKFGLGGFVSPLPTLNPINDNGPIRSAPAQLDAGPALGSAPDGGGGAPVQSEQVEADDTLDPDTDEEGPDATPRANRAPVNANAVFLYEIFIGQSLVIGLAQLLSQTTDPDGNPLDIRNISVSWGSVVEEAPGRWLFKAEEERIGTVTFSYDVTDGESTVTQTATLDVVQVPGVNLAGTDAPDVLLASAGDDTVSGLGGDDDLIGREGRDSLDGGAGNDRLVGGAGADVLYGGSGNDVLFGGDGDDTLFGGDGDDVIHGGAGNDLILADSGNDTVEDGDGADLVDLGTGNDLLLVTDDGASDVFDGNGGQDTISYALLSAGRSVEINLQDARASIRAPAAAAPAPQAAPGSVPVDFVIGFEDVVGSSEADLITGNTDANVIEAGAGADTVDAGAGDDTLIATTDGAADAFDGGAGIDTYSGADLTTAVTIDLEAGTVTSHPPIEPATPDVPVAVGAEPEVTTPAPEVTLSEVVSRVPETFELPAAESGGTQAAPVSSADATPETDTIVNIENVIGSDHDDIIIGDAEDNVIDAGLGNDVVAAGAGDDTIMIAERDGADDYDGGSGRDTLDASANDISIVIDLAAGTISAESGDVDYISSFESVIGGRSDDTIIAGFGQDDLTGGLGDDIFVFQTTMTSGKGQGSRDRILDYSVGDRVDLSGIINEFAPAELADAIADEQIQSFVLIRDGAEFSRPGQLKIAYEELEGQQVAVLQGSINWDSTADFEIEIHGLTQDTLYL